MCNPPLISNDSGSSDSYAISSSPASTTSERDSTIKILDDLSTQGISTVAIENLNTETNNLSLRTTEEVNEAVQPPNAEHVIHLSSIEHCMPRAYIRICMAFRLPTDTTVKEVVDKLDAFVRKTVDAKPYLSGYVVPTREPGPQIGTVEIRFSDQDFVEYPRTTVRHFTPEEIPYSYDELDRMSLPPSIIRPDLVSALPEGTDDNEAPVFRVQANVVPGGIIVSMYLHHCISDGTGLGLLVTGSVLHDDSSFVRYLKVNNSDIPSLSHRLDIFANQMSIIRTSLSWSNANQVPTRHIQHRQIRPVEGVPTRVQAPGRGCVFALSRPKLAELKILLAAEIKHSFMSAHDVLQAFLWHHMTKARIPSLQDVDKITDSKLLIPVDIRNKLKEKLPDSYFGTAIDFAEVKLPLDHLAKFDSPSLAQTALTIRESINKVDDSYVRQAIALARKPDPNIDVRDLLACNMNRITGADMYITSWEKLKIYDYTLDLGLGRPDWVRKPWSKDPGSCIVLPNDDRKAYLEVVLQMTAKDMERLLDQPDFMAYVIRMVE